MLSILLAICHVPQSSKDHTAVHISDALHHHYDTIVTVIVIVNIIVMMFLQSSTP